MKISRRSVLYHVSVLSVSGVLFQGLGFLYQVVLSRSAGAQALGVYQLVFPVYSVVMAATLTGVRLAVTSLSAGLSPKGDLAAIRSLVRRSVACFVGLFVLAAVPVALLHDVIARQIIGEPRTSTALLVILACLFLTGFEGIFESLFLGIGRTQYTAISNLLEQVVKIFSVLWLLDTFGSPGDHARTAVLITLGMTISEIPVDIWLLAVYRRVVRGGYSKPSSRPVMRVLPIAVPVSLTAIATTLIASASVVLLPGRLALSGMTHDQAVAQLGIVSEMALPLITLPMVLIRSMSNVLLPVISESSLRGNKRNIERKIHKSFQATGLIVLPATAILVPLSTPLSKLLFHQPLSQTYVMILAIGAVITYYEVISVSILNGLGQQRMSNFCMVLGEGVQLFCTYFLAAKPQLGIYGYLLGGVLSPLFVLLFNLVLIRRHSGFSPRWTESLLLPLLTSLVAGLFTRYFYLTLLPTSCGEIAALALSAALGGGICLCIFLLTGLRPIRYYRTLAVPTEKRSLSRTLRE